MLIQIISLRISFHALTPRAQIVFGVIRCVVAQRMNLIKAANEKIGWLLFYPLARHLHALLLV